MLPREEILRYKKHIMLPEIGIEGQEKYETPGYW